MKQNKLFKTLIPLVVFILLGLLLWRGLDFDPEKLPSPLVGQKMPTFVLSTVENPNITISNQDLLGEIALVNVWATWCIACRAEHPMLMDLAQNQRITIYGLDYKDDRQSAQTWLSDFGNPYKINLFDPTGRVGIDWGVYGTPETFIIDREGIIRYKHVGVLDPDTIDNTIVPMVRTLQNE